MAGLDNIPQKQTVEIEIAKLDEATLKVITDANQKSNNLIADFGSIYIRKREIQDELTKLDELLEKAEYEFKSVNAELRDIFDELDEKYPQGRISLQDGTVSYQPGAPTRKQLQQQQQEAATGMKVVKE
jgi:hypothetical protein